MSEIILIFGKRGSGKTTLNKYLLQYKTRLLIFDPLGEHTDGRIFNKLTPLLSFLEDKTEDGLFRAIYRPLRPRSEYELFCEIGNLCNNITLAFEEIDIATKSNYCPGILEEIIFYGRHKGISIYGTTRRPTEIPKDLTSQANKIYTFRQHEPRDIEYFHKFVGSGIERALSLGKYEYLEFDLDNQTVKKGKCPL